MSSFVKYEPFFFCICIKLSNSYLLTILPIVSLLFCNEASYTNFSYICYFYIKEILWLTTLQREYFLFYNVYGAYCFVVMYVEIYRLVVSLGRLLLHLT